MSRSLLRICSTYGIAGLLAIPAAPAAAQLSPDRHFAPGVVTLAAWLGGAAYSDFRRGGARLSGSRAAADIDRRLSAKTSVAFSAAAWYWPSSWWGVRLHGSYSPTRFEVVLPEGGRNTGTLAQEPRLARLDVWLYDLDLVFRAPVAFGRVAPYGVV